MIGPAFWKVLDYLLSYFASIFTLNIPSGIFTLG